MDGPGWTDQKVAEAYRCRTRTVENVRRRCVLEAFELALNGKQRSSPPVPKLLYGEQEAQLIALRLGPPPPDDGSWSLRLLARQVAELKIVDSISHETARRTLSKSHERSATHPEGVKQVIVGASPERASTPTVPSAEGSQTRSHGR